VEQARRKAALATTNDHRRRGSIVAGAVAVEIPEAIEPSFALAQAQRTRYYGDTGVLELRQIYHQHGAHALPEQPRPSTSDVSGALNADISMTDIFGGGFDD